MSSTSRSVAGTVRISSDRHANPSINERGEAWYRDWAAEGRSRYWETFAVADQIRERESWYADPSLRPGDLCQLQRADGTYLYGTGRAVAGGGNWSWNGGNGGDEERGRWRAANGVLYVLGQDGQWARVGAYGMTEDGTAMRITYDSGGKKLWNRQ